jgi:hypothetical protein
MAKFPNRTISQFIPHQLPEFVRENYQTFIDFLQAYYEWMEESGNLTNAVTNVLDYRDIDETLDQFISHFQNEFMPNIPTNTLADKRKLVKHIKQFYRARGSEKSYKLLFRILFNEDVEFFYPKVDLLKPSDGTWSVDTVIRTTTNHNTFQYIGHQLTGQTSGATAFVENVIQFNIGGSIISEIYLSSIVGTFTAGEVVSFALPTNNFLETTYVLLTGATVTNPGLGYKPNDLVFVSGGGGQSAVAAVDVIFGTDTGRAVTSANSVFSGSILISPPTITLQDNSADATAVVDLVHGTLISVRVVDPGQGYLTAPNVTVVGGGAGTPAIAVAVLDTTGRVSLINIQTPGVGYTSTPSIVIDAPKAINYYDYLQITIMDGPGSGEIKTIVAYNPDTNIATVDSDWVNNPTGASHYSIDLGKIKSIKVKDFGIGFTSAPTLDLTQAGKGNATATAIIGPVGKYSGRWINTNSFLDSNQIIQDSFFWQDFSYVLRLGQSLNTYKDIVLKLLHPAGTILFGEVDLSNQFMIGPTYRTLERHKFFFAPYQHWENWSNEVGFPFYVNVGNPDFATNPLTSYPAPNSTYWGSPTGFGNTQNSIYAATIVGNPINKPDTRRNHVADAYLQMITANNSLPSPTDLIVVYNMVQGADPQVVYDIQNGRNGFFGRIPTTDSFDPTYNSVGVHFSSVVGAQYITATAAPVNPQKQTIIVIANSSSLARKQSILGCIDANKENTVTGYAININTDGSLDFVAQKDAGTQTFTLTAELAPGTVDQGEWFLASLRYAGNTVTGNVWNPRIQSQISNVFGTNVDAGVVLNDSLGYYIGNEGSIPPSVGDSFFQGTIWGRGFWQFQFVTQIVTPIFQSPWGGTQWGHGSPWGGLVTTETIVNPGQTLAGHFFFGDIAYVVIYNRALTDSELLQAYIYLRGVVASRGIILP